MGFETGDFTGWTVGIAPDGNAEVVASHPAGIVYDPVEGNYFARLEPGEPSKYTTLNQSLELAAGETLCGHAAFDSGEDYTHQDPWGNDNAAVRILDSAEKEIALPWYCNVTMLEPYGDGNWTSWEWTAPANGTYILEVRVINDIDAGYDSYALFDGCDGDTMPPAGITNLAASNPTRSTIKLSWIAPGDDGTTGTAAAYDIRYRIGAAVTDASWGSATQVAGEPQPQAAGSNETFTVTGLNPNTTYYFAIKTADEVPNWSPISNSPSGTTVEGNIFDTHAPAIPYPSISGTHKGTITPSINISISEMYTYPCPGTGGRTEYILISDHAGTIAEASWTPYHGDGHTITFNHSFTLAANETYNLTIITGSYPQIIHEPSWTATGGRITCTEFMDINGQQHEGWIPAIRLQ